MASIIKKTYKKYDYRIYTFDIDYFKRVINDENVLKEITIETKNKDELYEEYKKADYGFLLRDDNVINNVSYPTKLIEYLSFGIIPICDTKRIGDMEELKINTIDYRNIDSIQEIKSKEKKNIIHLNYETIRNNKNGQENKK